MIEWLKEVRKCSNIFISPCPYVLEMDGVPGASAAKLLVYRPHTEEISEPPQEKTCF